MPIIQLGLRLPRDPGVLIDQESQRGTEIQLYFIHKPEDPVLVTPSPPSSLSFNDHAFLVPDALTTPRIQVTGRIVHSESE